MKRRSSRKGFTLIEVLLVLVILVVLAGVVVTNLTGTQAKANAKAARITVQSLEQAAENYNLDVNAFPPNLEALLAPPGDMANPARWLGPYLKKGMPRDPWDQPFSYAYPGQHNPQLPDIWSNGPDLAPGTADDIGNWQQ